MNVSYDENGLPCLEWDDHGVSGGYISTKMTTTRRCRIAADPSGVFHFVHETSDYNRAAKPLLGAGLVGGWIGRKLAEHVAKAKGWGLTEKTESAPWDELQSFVLTDEGKYFGRRLISGEPLPVPDPVIVADFGQQHGEFVVSHGKLAPNVAAELHRRLSREFVLRRPEHMKRLAALMRQRGPGGAGEPTKII